ncbi:uncharacterized protein K452DRAFT_288217 [Aplosporella prunicola CBS 121167]|uniref:Nudix hydrolase domain-containing protein n=1 Tax=Aplosporella prunicola CBS 121167 TaxID=1176127 RepID=A0A6A6BBV9_9PEZI|nr:uncharacterized protein K452DRAFT_288217 [Aplosporella prunicola CBS 121167]KAF2141526.1 hypothetical protein K452DRAFT_288217 [Aplosporella prunicola CBS 121167]
MSSAGEPTTEKLFAFPEDLSQLSVDHATFLRLHPKYHQVAVGALVFHNDRLLLVKRSATERSFANCWEFPGGSVDPEDKTIFHAVARELMEEAGLRAVSILNQVGEGVEFHSGWGMRKKMWLKLSFEVEVAEGKEKTEKDIPVKLDPIEHQAYLWVTEDDIRRGEVDGIQLQFVTAAQTAVMLECFRQRRERAG